jgi:hypothetical protein
MTQVIRDFGRINQLKIYKLELAIRVIELKHTNKLRMKLIAIKGLDQIPMRM